MTLPYTVILALTASLVQMHALADELPATALTVVAAQPSATGQNETQAATTAVAQSCSWISTFRQPPSAKKYYPAMISAVDDMAVGEGRAVIKLNAASHVVALHEYITDDRIRRPTTIQRAKKLTLQLEPNKEYHLAAAFFPDKRFSRREEYWQPVVWLVTERACE